jgi:hypothetical protein
LKLRTPHLHPQNGGAGHASKLRAPPTCPLWAPRAIWQDNSRKIAGVANGLAFEGVAAKLRTPPATHAILRWLQPTEKSGRCTHPEIRAGAAHSIQNWIEHDRRCNQPKIRPVAALGQAPNNRLIIFHETVSARQCRQPIQNWARCRPPGSNANHAPGAWLGKRQKLGRQATAPKLGPLNVSADLRPRPQNLQQHSRDCFVRFKLDPFLHTYSSK